MKTRLLSGVRLAKEYARTHPLSESNPGKVHGYYLGGGWISLSGSGLKPHPDMVALHPNGWCLGCHVRSSVARLRIANNHSELRAHYAACGVPVSTPEVSLTVEAG